jgi:hypothetical protein
MPNPISPYSTDLLDNGDWNFNKLYINYPSFYKDFICGITIGHDTTDKLIWSGFPNGVCSAHYVIGDWIWFQLNMMHPLLLGVGFGDYQLMKT